ncbi:hypothetical protein COV19_03040 [Candidatus Woesearchaeota archaeon CG10_big_fil_rev_8_21_14_0_10_44_13]|nr:MAG: hypothetical protein COV19_03040 [Candidatus Woesearchaeota archaeon CG10_big_fil_rev_8_21_14_0_10_44_13]
MLHYFKKYWGGWKPKVFRRDFNSKNTKIILKNNKRVGYYVLKQEKKFTYVGNVQISTLFRGKGIGTYIMKLIERQTMK